MTIALDTYVGISVDYAKTATASITVGSGTGRIVIVEVEGAQSEITSVTVGAQTATFYTAYDNSSGSPVSAWYVLNPTSGAQTVTVTFVSSSAESSGVITSWSGVDQTTPFVSSAGISGPYLATPSNVTLASALSGGQVALSFIASKPFSGDTFVAGGTLIASKSNGGSSAGAVLAAAQYYTAGGTTQTTWTWATSAAQKQGSHLAIVLNPASGGTGITPALTSPTATAISSTQASYSVTTNEAGGTLYRLFSTNATETAATIKAANLTQAVTAAGAQTGNTTVALSPSTTYYGHFVYVDGSSAQSAPVDTASFTTPAGSGATAVTLSGPTGGVAGVTSTNFTAGANGTITGTVVVTPSDGGAGGAFTPTTVSLTSGAPTATFTYTPSTAGTKTISVTNNVSLTNPGSISYAATSANTASFTCDVMINNANSIYKSQSVVWSWHQAGRIGQTSTSVTYGTGTINASGALVLTGLPAGAGFGLVAVRNTSALDDAVFYQAGTAA